MMLKMIFGNSKNKCEKHQLQGIKVCCNDHCKDRRIICHQSACMDLHSGHLTLQCNEFTKLDNRTVNQIKYRHQMESIIKNYYEKYISTIRNICKKEQQKLIDSIDRKMFSKKFIDLYKKYINGEEYYSLLDHDIQSSRASQVLEAVKKKIKEKDKELAQVLKQGLVSQTIILDQSIVFQNQISRETFAYTNIEKLKSILPFDCDMRLKFRASKNKFLTENFYDIFYVESKNKERRVNFPIVLIAQSYKNKTFGGYSPNMFPRIQDYEPDKTGTSFLFSLDNRAILPLKEQNKKFAIKGGPNLIFGEGDLVIADQCNKANLSWAQIGRAYSLPRGIYGNTSQWLGGAKYFRILEYQIYQVKILSKQWFTKP